MIRYLLLTLFVSQQVFAGAQELKDKGLPDVKLNSGQIALLENYLRKKDKSGLTDHLRVEFVCSRKKKKKYLDPNDFNCKLIEIN